MASITLTVIKCIDYLAYGTVFTRAMFLQKKILDVFSSPKNTKMRAGRLVLRVTAVGSVDLLLV
jgi:hypothetical protein